MTKILNHEVKKTDICYVCMKCGRAEADGSGFMLFGCRPEEKVDPIKRDKKIVYYGPHPCQKCDPTGKLGTLIVKAGNGAPDYLEYDFTHDSHYPNHVWKKHVHSKKSRKAVALGSVKSPKKSKAARNNGKLGGRPKKII